MTDSKSQNGACATLAAQEVEQRRMRAVCAAAVAPLVLATVALAALAQIGAVHVAWCNILLALTCVTMIAALAWHHQCINTRLAVELVRAIAAGGETRMAELTATMEECHRDMIVALNTPSQPATPARNGHHGGGLHSIPGGGYG